MDENRTVNREDVTNFLLHLFAKNRQKPLFCNRIGAVFGHFAQLARQINFAATQRIQ
jgi:hypothetical protein